MKKILSLFAMCAFLVGISLAGPAFAADPPDDEKSNNAATGIGKNGTPPGKADGPAKENAPGQTKKDAGGPELEE